jgi:hypothetical protein
MHPVIVSAEELAIVIRTFIPVEHPGIPGYMLPVPGRLGSTMLPEAPVGQCFGTDSRSFSNERNASSRFGGMITVDLETSSQPKLSIITGVTREYECSTGKLICEKPAGGGGFSIDNIEMSASEIKFTYEGEANNPCLPVAPDIEFTGNVRIDRNTRTVAIDAKNDVFPSFEAVLLTSGGAKQLFRMGPEDKSTPADLLTSSASRPISGSAPF